MTEIVDTLDIAEGQRLSVVSHADGLAAVPMTRTRDDTWRRATPGDGAAAALIGLLAGTPGSVITGRFTVRSWTTQTAAGERPIGVDQTNESVIVGDAAVVKWATHLGAGPHPAPRRISVLREAGFRGMPAPWGLITWQAPDGAETLVANVDAYLPDAVDGWTWAVDLITTATRERREDPLLAAVTDVGALIAELHAALSGTARVAAERDAARWRDTAVETLDTVCALEDSASVRTVRARRTEIETVLGRLGGLAGTPIIEGHGDLHVGQVLSSDGRFVVTDFDGNPVLPAWQRTLPIPAALDVAGMAQSLGHAAIVAARYTHLDANALTEIDTVGRVAFLAAYTRRLAALGHAELFDPGPLHAFRVQQVLREIIYAAHHLPRWMYVPDAALPTLLDERPAL